MAKRMPSLCIEFFKSYKSASMSLFKISGASKDPYLLTVLPSLLTKNLEKFHLTDSVPRKPLACFFKNSKTGDALSPFTSTLLNIGKEIE